MLWMWLTSGSVLDGGQVVSEVQRLGTRTDDRVDENVEKIALAVASLRLIQLQRQTYTHHSRSHNRSGKGERYTHGPITESQSEWGGRTSHVQTTHRVTVGVGRENVTRTHQSQSHSRSGEGEHQLHLSEQSGKT